MTLSHRNFTSGSLDECTTILSREWSRHSITLPTARPLRLRFDIQRLTPSVSLSRLSYGAEVIVRPEERADVLLVKMPLDGEAALTAGATSTSINSHTYALVDVPSADQLYCKADLDMLVLRIDYARLHTVLAGLLGTRPSKRVRFSPALVEGTAAWRLWAPVAQALATMQRSNSAEIGTSDLHRALELWVLTSLLTAQPSNYSAQLQKGARTEIAPRHVRRAEDFIHAHLGDRIDAPSIAAHAQVSVRSLFNGFQRFRGISPSEYVRKARLEAAHAALMREECSVGQIAARCGFRSMGHFHEQYKQHYGCSPGATLAAHSDKTRVGG